MIGFETGYSQYTGTGSRQLFEYGFTVIEDSDVKVLVDGAVPVYTKQSNGVVITPAPALNAVVELFRYTDVTQLRDWVPFDSFDAEWTEDACDKLIMLKQEAWYRTKMNLASEHLLDRVILHNDKGTDAHLFLWNEVDPLDDIVINEAGVFAGEVTEDMPEPGTYVLKPEDFAYFQWGQEAPVNQLILTSTLYPIEVEDGVNFGASLTDAAVWSWPDNAMDVAFSQPAIAMQDGLITGPTSEDELDVAFSQVFIEMTSNLITAPPVEDQMDIAFSQTSIDMAPALVSATTREDGARFVTNVISGWVSGLETPYVGTNLVTNSSDLTHADWIIQGTPPRSFDQEGISHLPNEASRIEDNSTGTFEYVLQSYDNGAPDSTRWTMRCFVKKQTSADGNNPAYANVGIRFNSAALTGWSGGQSATWQFNSITGDVLLRYDQTTAGDAGIIVREYAFNPKWWEILIDATSNNYQHVGILAAPVFSNQWDTGSDASATGSYIWGNGELYSNTAKESVTGGPVYT